MKIENTICDNVHLWQIVKCTKISCCYSDHNRKIHQQSQKLSTKINPNYCLMRINKCHTDIRIGIYDGLSCVCVCGCGCEWASHRGVVLVPHSTKFFKWNFPSYHRFICLWKVDKNRIWIGKPKRKRRMKQIDDLKKKNWTVQAIRLPKLMDVCMWIKSVCEKQESTKLTIKPVKY